MILDTLRSAWWVTRHPRIFGVSATVTIGAGFALSALGVPGRPLSVLSANEISAIIAVLLVRSWLGLAIAATALRVLRSERTAPLVAGVPVHTAIGALLVSIPPVAPIVVGAFLLVPGQVFFTLLGALLAIGGAYWVAMWSQAGMMLIDGRAGFVESTEASSFMTRGYRGEILGFWLLVGAGVAAATWLDSWASPFMDAYSLGRPIAAMAHLVLRVVSDAFCTCSVAALYYELDKADSPRV
jgi:hypothetical protein